MDKQQTETGNIDSRCPISRYPELMTKVYLTDPLATAVVVVNYESLILLIVTSFLHSS